MKAESVVNDFLSAYLNDRDGGGVRSDDEYLALFPGFEDVIERELEMLRSPANDKAETPQLGPYRLLDELGRGSQGRVYLAQDTRLPRRVALKVLSGISLGNEIGRLRFQREAEIISKLDHPGICGVYEVAEHAGRVCIAMRALDGETLQARLQRSPVPPRTPEEVQRTLSWIEEAARACHVAHTAGIVHRDIKPGNLMLTRDGHAVLLDFGIAHDVDAATLTMTGDVLGTPAYMAPEQIEGDARLLDHQVDVYALGVTLFEALTGRVPFDGTRETLYHRILTRPMPDPRRWNRVLERDVRAVLEKALEKDPRRRYGTALDLAEELERLRLGRPVRARAITGTERVWRWAKREPVRAGLALATLLAVTSGTYLATNWNRILEAREQARLELRQTWIDEGFDALAFGSSEVAEERFDAALEVLPLVPEALLGKGICLLNREERDETTALLDQHAALVEQYPDLEWLRVMAVEPNDFEGHKRAFETVDARNSPLTIFLRGLRNAAGLDWSAENAGRAREFFRQTIVTSPEARGLLRAPKDLGAWRAPEFPPADVAGLHLILTIRPAERGDRLGGPVLARAGDVDGDGREDILVQYARGEVRKATRFVRLHSGRDGRVLRTYWLGEPVEPEEPIAPGRFHDGYDPPLTVRRVHDLDGDGVPEHLIATGNYYDPDPNRFGIVKIHSGRTGIPLHRLVGEPGQGSIGCYVQLLGDLDADGGPELFVTTDARAFFYSLRREAWIAECPWPYLGSHPIGDLDRDGVPDVLLGNQLADDNGLDSGAVEARSLGLAFRGKLDAVVLQRIAGKHIGDNAGKTVGSIGDLDGDGADEILVGEWLADGAGIDAGRVRVVSGRSGEDLFEMNGETRLAQFGKYLSGLGDVDGDGLPDLGVGAGRSMRGGHFAGTLYVFSGRDGSRLLTIDGERPYLGLGAGVADAGDVDGDGWPDVMAAVYPPSDWETLAAQAEVALPGEVRVYSVR